MRLDPFPWIRRMLAPINMCWYQHYALALTAVAVAGLLGIRAGIGAAIAIVLAETYKAFVYDRAHGMRDWRENWGDWIATALGCLMALIL